MPDTSLSLTEIEDRIGLFRNNLRELIEQAAASSGAANEDLVSRRIADHEAELEALTKRRDELVRSRA